VWFGDYVAAVVSKLALLLPVAVTALLATATGVQGQAIPSAYAQWSVGGTPPSSTGTLAVPTTEVPNATFQTNSDSPQVPSGASAYLGASTPFGTEFGSSQNRPYLNLRTVGVNPSTTTFTFGAPTPASGWGFAFGDIDADAVRIEAFDAGGAPVPAAALGFRGTFNYCNNTPTPCGPGTHTDVPTWNPVTSTLVGSGPDTSGAAGWFMPTASFTTLRLTFSRLSGSPIMQMWVAGHVPPPPTTTTSTSTSTSTTTTTCPCTTSTTMPTSTSSSSSTTPTTAPSTSSTPPPPPPAPPTTAPGPRLADTGAESGVLALIGVALLGLGVLVARISKRRTRPAD